jgi:pyrimidine-nucleoside phosphorylase
VDKHSTGGVGDKTTLILAPIVAASGAVVAKMSGRGLGHTGGTIDKMESAGLQTECSPEDFFEQARRIGLCVVGQNRCLAPADQKLYALRDVTATVDSIPLIASSIMSKKLASGAKNIVLDVKYGDGAFMKTKEDARLLAETMIRIGNRLGRRVRALLTDMNAPLGRAVGNALEVAEAIEILGGGGDPALRELCLMLAGEMLSLALGLSPSEGRALAEKNLDCGLAKEKMKEWFAAQGADPAVVEDPARLPQAPYRHEIRSPFGGFLSQMRAQTVGMAAASLGAGRKSKEDTIDPSAGILLHRFPGDAVKEGDLLAVLYASDPALFSRGEELFLSALSFSPRKLKKKNESIEVLKGEEL